MLNSIARYNSIIDVTLTDGSSFVGTDALTTVSATATQGQTEFVFEELEDGSLFLFFVDGVLYTEVDTLTDEKQFTFYATTGTVEVNSGIDAGVIVTALGAESGATLVTQDEPVTLDEAKLWCKIDLDDDDDLITALITAARQMCEKYTGVSFITRTVTAYLNNGCGGCYLPYGPVNSITSYTDIDGETVDADLIVIVGDKFKQLREPLTDYIKIIYTAGYTTLPENLKKAILQQIAYMYEHRGDSLAGEFSPVAKVILNQVKR
jgi:uncharacterized phiE125 gp8 family phage protein